MASEPEQHYELTVTVKGFVGTNALLALPDQQTISWPIKSLPDDLSEGSTFRLIAETERTSAASRAKLARAVLNQILQG